MRQRDMRGRDQPDYVMIRRRPRGSVARTQSITSRLMVDYDADGRILGVESIQGRITFDDLVTVLKAVCRP